MLEHPQGTLRLGLFLPVKLLPQSLDGGIHSLHAAQIEKQGTDPNGGVFGLQIALQAVGGNHIVRVQRFENFQIRTHSRPYSGHILISFGNGTQSGGAHTHQIQFQLVADVHRSR